MPNVLLKKRALALRKRGYSYSEIGNKIHVNKSTLSSWLRANPLTERQRARLDRKSEKNRKMGSQALLNDRIRRTISIVEAASAEVGYLSQKDLWLIGVILYWAEGSKQKIHDPSKGVVFSNSDPIMVKLFIKWLIECISIPKEDIAFEIYIHETYGRSTSKLVRFWSKITNFSPKWFQRIYYKKNKVRSFRKNRGAEYNGVLRVSVKRSTDLNRKITGWKDGVCAQFLA